MGRVISAENNNDNITIGIAIEDLVTKGQKALIDTAFVLGGALQNIRDNFDIYEKQNGVIVRINYFSVIEASFARSGKSNDDAIKIANDLISLFELSKEIFGWVNKFELMIDKNYKNMISKYIQEHCSVIVSLKEEF